MAIAAELQEAVGSVAERVGPAVVRIGRDGRGAGVVVNHGRVLTNAHNLRGAEVTVTFADGTSAVGAVQGADVDGDLAVVAVDTGGTEPIAWGGDPAPGVGAPVLAAARGPRGLRVTFGLVSSTQQAFRGPRGRRITGSLEHTAPLARGSSGGPLVDAEGRLVGINTNRLGDGFYLAIPADAELRRRVEQLAEGRSAERATLGIGLAPAGVARRLRRSVGLPERDGLLVHVVDEAGPAARAGLRQGDLIVEAGGRAVTTADDLYDALDGVEPGASLVLGIVRGAEELTVEVGFGDVAG